MNCTILLSLSVNSFGFVWTYALQWITNHMPQFIQIYWHLILYWIIYRLSWRVTTSMDSTNSGSKTDCWAWRFLGFRCFKKDDHHLGCTRPYGNRNILFKHRLWIGAGCLPSTVTYYSTHLIIVATLIIFFEPISLVTLGIMKYLFWCVCLFDA